MQPTKVIYAPNKTGQKLYKGEVVSLNFSNGDCQVLLGAYPTALESMQVVCAQETSAGVTGIIACVMEGGR